MYDIQLNNFDSRITAKKWRIYCKFSLLFLIAERGWLCVVEIARRLPLCELATASSKTKLYCETRGRGGWTKICISLYLSLSLLKRNCGICLWCSVNLHPETKEQDLNKNRLLAAARCIRRQEQGGGGGQQKKRREVVNREKEMGSGGRGEGSRYVRGNSVRKPWDKLSADVLATKNNTSVWYYVCVCKIGWQS